MIGVELLMEIRVLAKHGKGVREIARGSGRLAQHRAALSAADLIPAKVLFDEIRGRGYGGGYTMVKVFVATLKRSNAQTGAEAGAGCALRDDSGSANAGRLGDVPARMEQVVGLRRDARLEPDGRHAQGRPAPGQTEGGDAPCGQRLQAPDR